MRGRALVWALVVVEVVASVVDLLFGPWARVHWEERFNARAGAQFACDHWDRWWELQYRTFCGGCTGEAIVAAPLFEQFGATILVWKTIPLAFHCVVTAAGAAFCNRIHWKAGVAWCLLMLGAPGFYRDLIHTGWGNHAESAAFTLLAALLVASAAERHRALQVTLFFLAGVVAGFGVWFAHISVHAVPALLVAAALLWWKGSPALLVGSVVGFSPWFWVYTNRPHARTETIDWFSMFTPAPPSAMLDWLWGGFIRDGLWPIQVNPMPGRLVVEYGNLGPIPSIWWFVIWALAIAGMVWAARKRHVFPLIAMGVLLAAYALRYDLWDDNPTDIAFATFHLRYRAPLIPLLFLGVAAACSAPGRWAHGALGAVIALAGLGIGLRLGKWGPLRIGNLDVAIYAPDGRTDQTVPTGQPKQRNRDAQFRPQDLDAAFDFLARHTDPLPACRYDHLSELGRRIGLVLERRPDDVDELVRRSMAYAEDEESRRHITNGLARALIDEHGKTHVDVVPTLDRLEIGDALGEAVGRRAAKAMLAEDHPLLEDPRVWAGACEALGLDWIAEVSLQGELPPSIFRDLPFDEHVGACLDEPWTYEGVGRGWARWVSCEIPPADPRSLGGWETACPVWRGATTAP